MIKANIVLCLPGSRASTKFFLSVMSIYGYFASKGKSVFLSAAQGNVVAIVRNTCLRQSPSGILDERIDQKPFNGEIDYDHIIWMDNDNLPTPPMIEKLMSHDEDIVSGWYRGNLAVGENLSEDMNRLVCGPYSEEAHDHVGYIQKDFLALPRNKKGLIEVGWTGFGLVCMKKGVIEILDYPWFQNPTKTYQKEDGSWCARIVSDDIFFCQQATEAGLSVFVDPEVNIKHEKTIEI